MFGAWADLSRKRGWCWLSWGLLAAFLGASALAQPPSSPSTCRPSPWGPKDEVGNANLITPAAVLAAIQLVRTGETYSLGITIDQATPAFPPRSVALQVVQPNQQRGRAAFPNFTYNDDVFQGWFGVGSQIDGLGHLGSADGEYYNCNNAKDFAFLTGLTKLGVEKIPPLVARGIVLDMAGYFGIEAMEAGQAFTVKDVQAVEAAQGTPIRAGDVVLFHTGWLDAKLHSAPQEWIAAEPGQSEEVAQYLASKKVVAAGADTWGLDVVPPEDPQRPFQGHVILLKEHGIYILEAMNTGPLVRDGVFEFLFVLGAAKVRGAAQMIVNPVAIH